MMTFLMFIPKFYNNLNSFIEWHLEVTREMMIDLYVSKQY